MSDMRASEVIVKKQQKMIRKKGRPLGYDPDEILEIAMNLFWANGYEATSLDDILNATNIAKSSFYHMFGNKQQLFERCLNRYCDRQVALIEESIQQSSTGRDFIEKFLIVDSDDGHFMLRQTPCPFLGSDKYCSVYESRPRACAGFPHTDRRGVAEILPLILRNAEICPAVAFMLCRLCPR